MEQELCNDERMDIPLEETDDLYHHGIKGMKWGVRRFQFKDGSLTKRGEKRYNKEVAKLKAKKKKLKNEERVKKKLGKLDKLKTEVDDLEAKKKASKKNDQSEETAEQKRERLLKSTDAKEIYENRNLLTYQELNERINRIDIEAKLQGKIPQEKKQTGMDWVNDKMQKTDNTIKNATNLYKSVDGAYNTFVNSTAGKIMENSLGVKFPKGEKPKRQYNKEDFNKLWENRKNLNDDQMRDYEKAVKTALNIKQNLDKLNGKDTGNKGKGMSEQDIEDIIRRMVNEDYLEQSAMNSSIDAYDTLIHFGIKGMKWGVHRFYNADGSRTAAGKKRENEARSLSRKSHNGLVTEKNVKQYDAAYDDYIKHKKISKKYFGYRSLSAKHKNPHADKLKEAEQNYRKKLCDFLDTLSKDELKKVITYDYEHDEFYVNDSLFDSTVEYEGGITVPYKYGDKKNKR